MSGASADEEKGEGAPQRWQYWGAPHFPLALPLFSSTTPNIHRQTRSTAAALAANAAQHPSGAIASKRSDHSCPPPRAFCANQECFSPLPG